VVGRKRHVLTDTLGLLLAVNVHPASVQDRDGAESLLKEARRSFPFVERIIGDAGYQGRKMEAARRPHRRVETADRAPLRPATASSCSQNAGSWSAPSPGSAVAVGSPATTNVTPARPPPSSASP